MAPTVTPASDHGRCHHRRGQHLRGVHPGLVARILNRTGDDRGSRPLSHVSDEPAFLPGPGRLPAYARHHPRPAGSAGCRPRRSKASPPSAPSAASTRWNTRGRSSSKSRDALNSRPMEWSSLSRSTSSRRSSTEAAEALKISGIGAVKEAFPGKREFNACIRSDSGSRLGPGIRVWNHRAGAND